MEIIKYVYSFDDEKKHWEYCERNKFPFILLKDVYGNYRFGTYIKRNK